MGMRMFLIKGVELEICGYRTCNMYISICVSICESLGDVICKRGARMFVE